jgi:hypothetical protein
MKLRWLGYLLWALLGEILVFTFSSNVYAVPAFARQTGQNCNACHVSFPELTPYGRWFKLTGYTIGERTIPLAMMAEVSRTSTKNNTDPATGFALTPENNDVVLQDVSLFLAGKATDHIGGFVQWTYDHQAHLDQDPVTGQWTRGGHSALDNTDIRAVGSYVAPGGKEPELIYGLTLNNNPTMQDLWNTTPAWSFPFTGSSTTQFGPPGTMIEGLAPAAGIGGYGFWKKTFYGEFSVYRTADRAFKLLRSGTPIADRPALKGYNPYWRFAYNREWGAHSLMLGTFGMIGDVYPDSTDTTTPTDRFKDIGVDAQYQYITDPHTITGQVSYIHEKQKWNATFPAGGTDNPSDTLNSFKAKATYYYQRKYGATIGYFTVTGSTDATFWGTTNGKPNTSGYILELNYLPIDNVRLMLQYTTYQKFEGVSSNFDGNGRNPHDNNTLFLNAWISF